MTKIEGQFRQAAVNLATQLQAASRTAAELAVSLGQAEQIIGLLKKYMTTTQLVHAQLEIDAARVACVTSVHAQSNTDDSLELVAYDLAEAFRVVANNDFSLRDGAERMTAFGYFRRGVAHARSLESLTAHGSDLVKITRVEGVLRATRRQEKPA